MPKVYNQSFYSDQVDGSHRSALEVVPFVLELTRARSVIDVGCGLGTWLAAYAANGVQEYLGLDGAWVSSSSLRIPEQCFHSVDLARLSTLDRRFDVAQSLEVAEHLPEQSARQLVDFLTGLSDIVVFSAASPHQGGTHHVNEQWPEYWGALFAERGYALYDMFRPKFWMNDNVEWWYAQNMFLYVKREVAASIAACANLGEGFKYPERVVHPKRIDPAFQSPLGLGAFLRSTPRTLARACKQTASRLPARAMHVVSQISPRSA